MEHSKSHSWIAHVPITDGPRSVVILGTRCSGGVLGSGDPHHLSLDLGRPSLQVHERFRLRPEAGGGWEAVAVALTRKLQALAQLGLIWVRVERDER